MKYISIDGDDIGRKITSLYLINNEVELGRLSKNLKESTLKIAEMLSEKGFKVIFCAADGVVASSDESHDFQAIFKEICSLSPNGITYSAGVGGSLQESYVALLSAKSNGKRCIHKYDEINK